MSGHGLPEEFADNAGNPLDVSGASSSSVHTLPIHLVVDDCYIFTLRDRVYTFKVSGYDDEHNINVTWLDGNYPNDDEGWFSATQILYESTSLTGYNDEVTFTPTDCPPGLAGGRRMTRRRRTNRMKKNRKHQRNPTRRALKAKLLRKRK